MAIPGGFSPEAAAVSLNSHLLTDAVSNIAGVPWFAQVLTENGFITRQVRNDVISTLRFSDAEKCSRLLSAVETQVAANPAQFHALVAIFRSEGALLWYADVITKSYEIESRKRKSTISQHSSPSHSPRTIPKFMLDFGAMVSDVAQILQRQEGALERMIVTFEQAAIQMKSKTYTALINSKEYCNVSSVRAFFKLLAPYWKPFHCPLLIDLVNVTECKAAIDRLQQYLTSREKAGAKVVLGEGGENMNVPLPDATGEHALVTTPEFQESPPRGSPPSGEPAAVTLSISSVPNSSLPHSDGSVSPHDPDAPGQQPESDITLSQPTANMDSLPISAKVAQDRVTWSEYDRKTSLLCGVLRIPSFMLQYIGIEPGSVVIKWVTSDGILSYILSNMIDSGDLQLLLQENIVSIQVGSEHTITVGSLGYWKPKESSQYLSEQLITDGPSASTDLLDNLPISLSDSSEGSTEDDYVDEPDVYMSDTPGDTPEESSQYLPEQLITDGPFAFTDLPDNLGAKQLPISLSVSSEGSTEDDYVDAPDVYMYMTDLIHDMRAFIRGIDSREDTIPVTDGDEYQSEDLNERLWSAADRGDVTTAAMLLDAGADINYANKDSFSQTPLHGASGGGHSSTVQLLIERGAEVDARDQLCGTALYWTSGRGELTVVKTLLASGASVNAQTDDGMTPLMAAALKGYSDIVKELLQHRASINMQSKSGWTALYWASFWGRLSVVKTLLASGANVDAQTDDGDSAVIVATQEYYPEVVQQLAESGADLNLQNEEGLTALMIAVKSGRTDLTEILIKEQCDLNIQENNTGWSALFFAADNGDVATIKLLLKAGANALLKDRNSATALDVARVKGEKKGREEEEKEEKGKERKVPKWQEVCELLTEHMKENATPSHMGTPPTQQKSAPPNQHDVLPAKQQSTHSTQLDKPSQQQTTSQHRGGITETMRNAINRAGNTIGALFNQLERRLKSKEEKDALITTLAAGARKVKKSTPRKSKSGQQSSRSKTVHVTQ